jgi:CRISPR-associated exonuclease Cas4
MYEDSQLLMISGIQHYAFCKRQWALIHMEQQWHDNVYTVRGDIVHEKVDDPFIKESRGKHFVSRSLPVASYELGFYGIMDLVNFYEDENGIYMPTKGKSYIASPVEYK